MTHDTNTQWGHRLMPWAGYDPRCCHGCSVVGMALMPGTDGELLRELGETRTAHDALALRRLFSEAMEALGCILRKPGDSTAASGDVHCNGAGCAPRYTCNCACAVCWPQPGDDAKWCEACRGTGLMEHPGEDEPTTTRGNDASTDTRGRGDGAGRDDGGVPGGADRRGDDQAPAGDVPVGGPSSTRRPFDATLGEHDLEALRIFLGGMLRERRENPKAVLALTRIENLEERDVLWTLPVEQLERIHAAVRYLDEARDPRPLPREVDYVR